MREFANAIDELLSTIKMPKEEEEGEEEGHASIPEFGQASNPLNGNYQMYDDLWSLIHDESYQEAARILSLESCQLPEREKHRTKALLSLLCERTLKDDSNPNNAIQAINALAALKVVPKEVRFQDWSKSRLKLASSEPVELVKRLELIQTVAEGLDLETEKGLRKLFNEAFPEKREEPERMLKFALAFSGSRLSMLNDLAEEMFDEFASITKDRPTPLELFRLCRLLTQASDQPLPIEWSRKIANRLEDIGPFSTMDMILNPILGTGLTMNRTTDAPSLSHHFVPTNLPRIQKLHL